jgi:hypothetical protein
MDRIESELDRLEKQQIDKNGAELSVQFQRIAMLQAEVDRLKVNERALQSQVDQLRAKNSQQGA